MLSLLYLQQFSAHQPPSIPAGAGYLSDPTLLQLDDLSWLIIWITAATSALLAFSAISSRRLMTFVLLAAVLLACTIVLTAIDNILLFFVLWELAAIICWAIAKSGLRDFNAAIGPLATSWTGSIGSVAMLVMTVLLIIQSGTLSISDLNTSTPELVVALLIVGISFKSMGLLATAWFPGRERVFASTNALLAGVGVVVVGLYPYIRITQVVLNSHQGWQDAAIWSTLAISLLFTLAALREHDLYRICSYIAFAQFFVLAAGFTIGDQYAVQGALLGLIGYVATVIAFFLTAGLVHQATGSRSIGQSRSLISAQPVLAVLFFVSAMSVIGLPPLLGFATKSMISINLFQRDQLHAVLWISIWLVSAIAIVRVFQLAFVNVRERRLALVTSGEPVRWLALVPLGVAVVFLLSASFLQQDILSWLQPVVTIVSG